MYILGFDIGGTKCAVMTALWDGNEIKLEKKEKCATNLEIPPEEMIDRLISMAEGILDKKPDAIGISCGGPLSSEKGIIMSPPNLTGWDNVEIVKQIDVCMESVLFRADNNAKYLYEYVKDLQKRAAKIKKLDLILWMTKL